MPTDIIREYLIKLGVDISANEISKMDEALDKMDKGIVSFFKRWNNAFLHIGKAYTKIVSRVLKFNTEIAQNDMYLQRWAKTMYLTADSARALDRTLSAMGLDVEDLKDVALNPELTKQYKELLQLSKSLTVGESFDKAAKHFREINFEFQKTKVILEYFRERIVAYTWKFMESSAGKNLQKLLSNLNQFGINIMDKVAQKVGLFFSKIITVATRLMELGQGIYNTFVKPIMSFFDSMGSWGKIFTSTFAEIGLAILSGPFGKAFLAIQKFVELIDDIIVWEQGGKSAFGGLWDTLFPNVKKQPEGTPQAQGFVTKEEWGKVNPIYRPFGYLGEFVGNIPRYMVEGVDYWLTGDVHQESAGNRAWERDIKIPDIKLPNIENKIPDIKLPNIENKLPNINIPELEIKPLLLPELHDEAAQDAARREFIERNNQVSNVTTNNNTPINIYVTGAKDPQATAERTVALIRSYKGVYA